MRKVFPGVSENASGIFPELRVNTGSYYELHIITIYEM